jgi:hypothetical protein
LRFRDPPAYTASMEKRLVLLHGFTAEEALAAMRALKAAMPASADAAFATTTETNLTWKVGDLIEHVMEEHRLHASRRSPGEARLA